MESGSWARPKSRIQVIDALRGFAIAIILLIHCSNNFLYSTDMAWSAPQWLLGLDSTVRSTLYFLLEGKAYTIFALLFGYTFAMQYANQKRKGKDFSLRMFWRMILLIGFGVANAALFSGGDPLVFYALTMMVVIPLIRLNSVVLFALAVIFAAQPLQIIDSFRPIISNNYMGAYTELASANAGSGLLMTLYNNATLGLKACLLWALEEGRLAQTFALFLLGILAYRIEFFSLPSVRFRQMAVVSALLSVGLYILKAKIPFTGFTMYYNLMASLLLISLFVLAHRKWGEGKLFGHLSIYGRMSLTNFIGQSLICCTLFYAWGFHLTQYLGITLSVALGCVVLVLQIWLSEMWLSRHSKGPLEGLWHHLTWLKFK